MISIEEVFLKGRRGFHPLQDAGQIGDVHMMHQNVMERANPLCQCDNTVVFIGVTTQKSKVDCTLLFSLEGATSPPISKLIHT